MILGCFAIYSALFSTGYFIYGEITSGIIFLTTTIVFSYILFNISKKILSNEWVIKTHETRDYPGNKTWKNS